MGERGRGGGGHTVHTLTRVPACTKAQIIAHTRTQLKELPGVYMELTKMRLSGLVLLTTMVGYAVAPGAVNASTLLWTSLGRDGCV